MIPRLAPTSSATPEPERLYTAAEVAELLQRTRRTIHNMFYDEPGVIRLNHKKFLGGRSHVTLRIPHSVLSRVLRRMTVA